MDVSGIKERIIEVISPVLDEHFVSLVDVEFKNRKGQKVITIFVDKSGGVNIADCAELSSIIGDIFDVEDIFPYPYFLEVSSPGLDRPLTQKSDFERNTGKKIDLFLDDTDTKKLIGIIKAVKVDGIQLETPKGKIDIPFSKIIKAKKIVTIDHVN
jgi:ribosome maturation factor RimP